MGRTWKTSIKAIQKIKLGKNADFMPSNTDLAPSNNWTDDIGWPGNEALDNVWPRDDGENYYSPKDDRPREKSVWWKLLNMFKKQQPLGKKDIVPVKEAKQWTTPKEPINQAGMAWNWADEVYNYVGNIWQDLLSGWLNLDPKNYIKPAILIEKIYEDAGIVSAWVHIEFINTAGNTDAFMKLVISANVQGEQSIEPEGREYSEHLTDWEIDVLDYGVKDELEKQSGYGPTNYRGPSVADHGYQNSAWDDMNVTYSPEEDEKFLDQNGADGYPNRWMGRHRGPYYTNEGKVVKMLEETSAALSKKEIDKIALRGPIFIWLSPDGKEFATGDAHSHGAWVEENKPMLEKQYGLKKLSPVFGGDEISDADWLISKGWVRVTGYMPTEMDLNVADINNIPEVAEQLVWREKPEVVIVEDLNHNDDSFDREEYSKGLMKKAALSGQVVNNILKLIQQNGGATYNISKGNLVGKDGYAVAIYPDREQIVSGIDYDILEGYIVQNEDLLSNSNNSFGAWVSGGKVYLDVVATVKDKRQAMELGYRHKQLAIFDLKNLVEIPLQRVAKLAGVYSDKDQQAIYDKQFSDRWRDSSDMIDGGFEYYDYSELNGNDFPAPKDLDKERALLDQLQKPIDRNVPQGLGEFQITWYDAMPSEGDHGGI